jgi:phage protein D
MSAMVTATIIANGNVIPGTFQLLAFNSVKCANKIPYAQLVFIDGSAAQQDFFISGSSWFALGAEIEIQLRDDNQYNDITVFKGLAAGQNIQTGASGSQLNINLIDKSTRLNGARGNTVFTQKSTHEVFEQLLKRNNIDIGTLQGGQESAEQLVQYQSNDWDFLLMRANASGLVVMVDDGVLSAQKIDLTVTPAHEFKYGISPCLKFEMNADASQQYGTFKAYGWDNENLLVSPAEQGPAFKLHQGSANLDLTTKAFNRDTINLQSMNQCSLSQGQIWAESAMQQDRLSMFRGTITLEGNPSYKLGDLIEISGVGALFNGTTLITGVSQLVDENGWSTVVQFGLSAQWHAELYPNVNALPAAGLVPNIGGIQCGIVLETSEAGPSPYLIPVAIAALRTQDNPNGDKVWARLSTPNAGKNKGIYFTPAVGDEVIIGFLNEDPCAPVILGAAFSQTNSLPSELGATDAAPWQGIVSKGNLQLGFNDNSRTIRLTVGKKDTETEDGSHNQEICEITLNENDGINVKDSFENYITLNSDGIVVQDKQKNLILMHDKGIEIRSSKDLDINADGNMSFNAKGNIKLNAKMIDLN